MEVQVNIGFDQLVRIVRALSKRQLDQLLREIEREKASISNLEELLLNGPVATEQQLETIAGNRKAINEWRLM